MFDRYSEEGDAFDDDWFEAFFDRAREDSEPVMLFIEWDNETDSGNYSSGDEAETIWLLSDDGFRAFWAESTSRGVQGPFPEVEDAARALGYDPAQFPPPPPDEEEGEDE